MVQVVDNTYKFLNGLRYCLIQIHFQLPLINRANSITIHLEITSLLVELQFPFDLRIPFTNTQIYSNITIT